MLATDFSNGLVALFSLLQDGDDLLVCQEALLRIGELTFLHASILPFGSILIALMIQFMGDGSLSSTHDEIAIGFLTIHDLHCEYFLLLKNIQSYASLRQT